MLGHRKPRKLRIRLIQLVGTPLCWWNNPVFNLHLPVAREAWLFHDDRLLQQYEELWNHRFWQHSEYLPLFQVTFPQLCNKKDVFKNLHSVCFPAFAVTGTNFTSHLSQLKPHCLLQRQYSNARNLFVGVFPKFWTFSRFGYQLHHSFSFYFPVLEYHMKYSLCDWYTLLLSA